MALGCSLLLKLVCIGFVLQANIDTTQSMNSNSENCCDFKKVGGVEYIKISHGAVPAQCKTDCIYEKKDKPGSRFCFARGKLEIQCLDGRQDTQEWSNVEDISWLTKDSLEVRFIANSKSKILLYPVNSSDTSSSEKCLFTGVLENDPNSAVDVSGCHDELQVNVTIVSNRFKEGIVFINILNGKIIEQDIPPYPYDEDMIMGLNTTDSKERKTMAISLWPNKVLWYDLSEISSFGHKTQIRNALNELARNVNTREICIQFKERTSGNRVKVTNNQAGCKSFVGYLRREEQGLNLNAASCRRKSTVQHEFFHALGLVHTQQRPDRDGFVRLLKDENTPGIDKSAFRANYGKCDNCNTYGIPYDFRSIMHYPVSSTMQALDSSNQALIGTSPSASPYDLEMLRRMYCGAEPPAFVSCGGHFASTCSACGTSCDGDCGWHNGQCKALVICGGHKAVVCEECGNVESWCNGDYTWLNGQCKEALKSCGGHSAPSCRECGRNPSYCNGDCVWSNGECTEVTVSGVSEPCSCQDHPGYTRNCPRWRSHCNGGRYQDWVTTRCPGTCNACRCCDERRDLRGSISCANWKMSGYCSHTYVNWMWLNCYKTCSSDDCTDCEPRSNNAL